MRSKSHAVLVASFLSILLSVPVFAADPASLYPLFHDKTVKVYVADVKDASKEHETDPKAIKSRIEEALKNRKSIRFETVQDPAQADLLIETEVSGFMWTDHDPVDMLMGAAATAYDIATIEDYARLEADITVLDAKAKKLLWKDRVAASITKKPMSRTDSIPLVTQEFAKTFIKECFSKKRS